MSVGIFAKRHKHMQVIRHNHIGANPSAMLLPAFSKLNQSRLHLWK